MKIRRYAEFINKKGICLIYDRLNRSIIYDKNSIERSEYLKRSIFDAFACFYPHNLIKGFSISHEKYCIIIALDLLINIISCVFAIIKIDIIITIGDFIKNIWLLPMMFFVSVFMHEISHAYAGVCHDGYVAEMGLCHKKRFPGYYTNVIWFETQLSSVYILYYISGICMNMSLFSIGLLAYAYTQWSFFWLFSVLNATLVLLNSLPIARMNTDGYKIASFIYNKHSCD